MRNVISIGLWVGVPLVILSVAMGQYSLGGSRSDLKTVDDQALSAIYGRGWWGCDADCLTISGNCPIEISEDGTSCDVDGKDCVGACAGSSYEACGNWQWQYIYWQCTNTTTNCGGELGTYVGWCWEGGCGVEAPDLVDNAPSCGSVTRPDC